eukprot:44954-Amphidinium_carterae.2
MLMRHVEGGCAYSRGAAAIGIVIFQAAFSLLHWRRLMGLKTGSVTLIATERVPPPGANGLHSSTRGVVLPTLRLQFLRKRRVTDSLHQLGDEYEPYVTGLCAGKRHVKPKVKSTSKSLSCTLQR